MLNQLEVINRSGEILPLTLGDISTGIILVGVDGLDPVQATISSSPYAQEDGQQYHSSRRESRNILLSMNLDSRFGGRTTRQLREQLYEFLMPKSEVTLALYLEDNPTVRIDGVVESLSSPMFMDKPRAIASIICHQPDFISSETNMGTGEGHTTTLQEYLINYEGTVETGLRIELGVNSGDTSSGFTVSMRAPNGDISELDFETSLIGNDTVVLDSTPGNKLAMLSRNNNAKSIISGISPTSVWPKLYPGENYIGIRTTGGQFYYEYFWQNRYGGL